jgi:hypothetical protein
VCVRTAGSLSSTIRLALSPGMTISVPSLSCVCACERECCVWVCGYAWMSVMCGKVYEGGYGDVRE